MKAVQKFDLVLADLNPRKSHTQAGIRPCVVVQSNLFNRSSSTIMIVPVTSIDKKIFPSEFWITPSKENGLGQRSRFLGSQVMTIDRKFISKKLGKLEQRYYPEVKEALTVSFDWENDFI